VLADAVVAQPWRNGGGTTRELLQWGARPGQPWQLRISLASVTQGGPFSPYPGVERWFAVVEGAGVALRLDEDAARGVLHQLGPHSAPLCFDGGVPVHCELLEGPTTDLNLMVAGGLGTMQSVLPGVPWTPRHEQAGLFACSAGQVLAPGMEALAVPERALLWFMQAPAGALSFAPLGARHDGHCGYWLGHTPRPPAH